MKLIKTKLIMSYKNKDYLLGEYADLRNSDFLSLKSGWRRKIRKELKLKKTDYKIWSIEDEYYKPESYLTLLKN